uniref:Uncharacterized protein n=1 Tax=Plectus sambesii TaxID=2011161 RepID=A0A914VJR3_9BILA
MPAVDRSTDDDAIRPQWTTAAMSAEERSRQLSSARWWLSDLRTAEKDARAHRAPHRGDGRTTICRSPPQPEHSLALLRAGVSDASVRHQSTHRRVTTGRHRRDNFVIAV